MIETKASGKLFIAGEYAVVEPGYSAILVAVDRFIKVKLGKSKELGKITSNEQTLNWTRKNNRLFVKEKDHNFIYIISAMNIVEEYAMELGKQLDFYYLGIESQLESKGGKKYGLGSSGAIIVATIKALCQYYKIKITHDELFKLSSLANLAINDNSSCGDIAAIVYGGWIAYTSFDRNWVLKRYKEESIKLILAKNWPKLKIQPLTPPREMELAVGWTGSPASTSDLVQQIKIQQVENNTYYEKFLFKSRQCVSNMITAFEKGNIEQIQKLIHINRQLLVNMGNTLGVILETPILEKLYSIGLKFNAYAKFSGAGGGDCGIAILANKKNLPELIDEWSRAGITYLPLKVYNP